ncbi:MAG TPA: hypothetical protein DEW35_04390 [Ruminococcaceae bacterium]|nr:hypothetical protein [Oscillospiraceae bacterium]
MRILISGVITIKKRPILWSSIAFVLEVYLLSVITHIFHLNEVIYEGVFSVLIVATAYLIVWLIVRKISKNNSIIVKISFIILLLMWIITFVSYLDDYIL